VLIENTKPYENQSNNKCRGLILGLRHGCDYEKREHEQHRHRQQDTVTIGLTEIVHNNAKWIHLVHVGNVIRLFLTHSYASALYKRWETPQLANFRGLCPMDLVKA
jgi:hypothetical protein